uniref:Myb-like domain-containing protein n=1 Tax=Percolomonas cosmopolitus TaxID=63605 RepID=A0A7S1KNH7_9EUKA|mmetsp:Transcript_2964/g.11326  ORF Transcript_2964/g.11326 Transcript_2964/m.11326 type:complete len:346 (+) Transcript_2964:964-2001(+)|eukprot:CAMPEP_0117450932 /NCGR_PEP_ID=MMETSP0759-20121206/8736_1 /TAXON_ID=63605 /ORGANISM="Percolomonas cosmopolitus, Strain WS" /LENGTH=345 /DNA_ID=CAMNT_0005243495 /DNA_START=897 /DNA_END=1934 /DNA_ORIENTATION=+
MTSPRGSIDATFDSGAPSSSIASPQHCYIGGLSPSHFNSSVALERSNNGGGRSGMLMEVADEAPPPAPRSSSAQSSFQFTVPSHFSTMDLQHHHESVNDSINSSGSTDLLDSISSDRPLKRRRVDTEVNPPTKVEPVVMDSTAPIVDQLIATPSANEEEEELPFQSDILSIQTSSNIWAHQIPTTNRFIAQPFNMFEPKARRRLNFSIAAMPIKTPDKDECQFVSGGSFVTVQNGQHRKVSRAGSAALTATETKKKPSRATRKKDPKKKKKRKGHTVVDEVTGMKTGTWTDDEHERFIEAMKLFQKGNWKDIARHVGTRTRVQCASHAQKVEIRMRKEREIEEAA